MKKTVTLLFLFITLTSLAFAKKKTEKETQSEEETESKSYKIYDVYKGAKGFSAFYMAEDFLNSLSSPIDSGKITTVDGKLTEIRMMFYNAKEGEFSARNFRKLVLKYLPRPPYRNISSATSDTIDVSSLEEAEELEFWVLGDDHNISECHIIMEDPNYGILISFYGDIIKEEILKEEKLTFWQRLFGFKREKYEEE